MPEKKGVQNAILVRGYYKNEFESFAEFKNKIIEKDVLGQPTQMNSNAIPFGRKYCQKLKELDPHIFTMSHLVAQCCIVNMF